MSNPPRSPSAAEIDAALRALPDPPGSIPVWTHLRPVVPNLRAMAASYGCWWGDPILRLPLTWMAYRLTPPPSPLADTPPVLKQSSGVATTLAASASRALPMYLHMGELFDPKRRGKRRAIWADYKPMALGVHRALGGESLDEYEAILFDEAYDQRWYFERRDPADPLALEASFAEVLRKLEPDDRHLRYIDYGLSAIDTQARGRRVEAPARDLGPWQAAVDSLYFQAVSRAEGSDPASLVAAAVAVLEQPPALDNDLPGVTLFRRSAADRFHVNHLAACRVLSTHRDLLTAAQQEDPFLQAAIARAPLDQLHAGTPFIQAAGQAYDLGQPARAWHALTHAAAMWKDLWDPALTRLILQLAEESGWDHIAAALRGMLEVHGVEARNAEPLSFGDLQG